MPVIQEFRETDCGKVQHRLVNNSDGHGKGQATTWVSYDRATRMFDPELRQYVVGVTAYFLPTEKIISVADWLNLSTVGPDVAAAEAPAALEQTPV